MHFVSYQLSHYASDTNLIINLRISFQIISENELAISLLKKNDIDIPEKDSDQMQKKNYLSHFFRFEINMNFGKKKYTEDL